MSKTRALTSGEIRLAQSVFQDSVDYARVKVHTAKYIFFQPDNSGMTPNGEMYIAGTAYTDDYALGDVESQCFFIHEMAHVWQYQNRILRVKTSAVWETLRHGFRYERAYLYTLQPDKDLRDYGLEQQAAIIEDFYRVLRLGADFRRKTREGYHVRNSPFECEELLKTVMRRFVNDSQCAGQK